MFCSKCGFEHSAHAVICPKCGTPTAKPNVAATTADNLCGSCGVRMPVNAVACQKCASRVEGKTRVSIPLGATPEDYGGFLMMIIGWLLSFTLIIPPIIFFKTRINRPRTARAIMIGYALGMLKILIAAAVLITIFVIFRDRIFG